MHKVTLNLDSQILAFGDQKLELGKNEFGILRTLLGCPGRS